MKKIVLIACCKTKMKRPAPAWRLYQSPLFRKSLAFAQTLGADKIYILSANYGLLDLNDLVKPYDITLRAMSPAARLLWAGAVLQRLEYRLATPVPQGGFWPPMGGAHFIFLAGRCYRELLTNRIELAESTWEAPLAGLGIGQQLAWLNQRLEQA